MVMASIRQRCAIHLARSSTAMLIAAMTLGGLGCGSPAGHPSNPGAKDARTGSAGANATGAAGEGGARGTAGIGTAGHDGGAGADSAPSTDADADAGTMPADFAALCGAACPCQTGSSPPRLVGSYV